MLILAAGLSRRLGFAKQHVRIHGTDLLTHTVNLAQSLAPASILLIINQEINLSADLSERVNLVINPVPEKGMGDSLSQLLTAAHDQLIVQPDRPVLILGIDQICLSTAHLQALLQQFDRHSSDHYSDQIMPLATVSSYANTIGLPVVVNAAALLHWQPQIGGDQGLKQLIRQHSRWNTIEAPELAYDLDTPDQFRAAQQMGWVDDEK